MARNVDFIHIGYHRCASTTLQADVFSQHPNVAVTKNHRLAVGAIRDLEQCNWLGEMRPFDARVRIVGVSSEGLCGVNYMANECSRNWGIVPEQIHEAWPNVKVLIIIRRQEDLIRSYYSLAVRKYVCTFSPNKYYNDIFRREYLFFDKLIERYIDLFGRRRVRVFPLEMLESECDEFLAELSAYLGVTFDRLPIRRRNEGGNDGANRVIRWINVGLKALRKERVLTEEKRLLRRGLSHILPDRKTFYAPEDSDRIRASYRDSNIRTSALIGCDLIGRYGY